MGLFHSPLFDQRDTISGEDAPTMDLQNPQWARWFDALKASSGDKTLKLGGAPGLPTDDHFGTLPLSLQGLIGGKYTYDDFGAPTSVSYRR